MHGVTPAQAASKGATEGSPSWSTLADVRGARATRRGRAVRRAMTLLLALVVIAGAVGGLGVRSAEVSSSGDGYRLQVTYGHVSRAGLDTPWIAVVTHPGGFHGPVTLATTASYFDIFESQGIHPQPASETAAGRYLYQQFDPPAGDTLRVDYDAYIQPASQIGRRATTVLIVDGHEVARVDYRTVLLP